MSTPVIQQMRVVPVAGHDSMLLNLSGAHGPYFTRNIVLLTDSAGHTGVGEVPGGEKIRQTLEDARAAGGRPADRQRTSALLKTGAAALRRPRRRRPRPADLRPAHHHPCGDRGRIRTARPARASTWACRWRRCSAKASSATRSRCWATCSSSATGPRPTCPIRASPTPTTTGPACATRRRMTPEAMVRLAEAAQRALRLQRLQAQGRRAARRGGDRGRRRRCTSASRRPASRSTRTAAGC